MKSSVVSKTTVLAASFFMTGHALAADHWHGSTIKIVYPMADGSFVMMFNSDSPQCPAPSPKYFYVTVGQNGMTQEGANKLYAAVLMAKATDMLVSIVFSDSTTYCYVNRLTLE